MSTTLGPKLNWFAYLDFAGCFLQRPADVLGLCASGKARLYTAELMNLAQFEKELEPVSASHRTINNNKKAKQLRSVKQSLMS